MFANRYATALFCALMLSTPAVAEQFRFVRPGDPDRIFKSNEPLVIGLPSALSKEELGSLFVELDGTDITQLISIEQGNAVYYPSSPHFPGAHALRLVRQGKNGKTNEINRWKFTVSGEPPEEQPSTLYGELDATYSVTAADTSAKGSRPDKQNLNSQLQINGATQSEGWQYSVRGNAFFNSEDTYTPGRDYAEVGEYLFSAEKASETGSTLLRLGNHNVGVDNILMNQFYRRGASARVDLLQDQLTVAGFSQDPANAIGNHNVLGFAEDNQRASGIYTSVRPIASLADSLELEGMVYTGRGTQYNTGSAGADIPQTEGRGYEFGVRSSLIADYLLVRAQHAHTNFDFDGRGGGYGALGDDANRLSFTLTPLGAQVDADGLIELWSVDFGYQKMGAFYESLLSQSEESDREKYSIGSNYSSGGTTVAGEMAYVISNVNDFVDIPTDQAWNGWAQASYAPAEEWWGNPVFMLGGSVSKEDRKETPSGYAGLDLDRFTGSVNGGVSLNFGNTTGTLSHTYTSFDDKAVTGNDYYSHFTEAALEFKATDWLTLRPGMQMEFYKLDDTKVSKSYHASLGADMLFIPDTLWNNTNYSRVINSGSHSSHGTDLFQTEFTWQIKPADVNSPGYAIALEGMHGNLTDPNTNLVLDDKDTRVYVRLRLNAPFSF